MEVIIQPDATAVSKLAARIFQDQLTRKPASVLGLATGSTMAAALRSVRARQPARLIAAVPVAAPDSLEMIAPLADEIVALAAPMNFTSVSRHYRAFPQVEEDEVLRLLSAG